MKRGEGIDCRTPGRILDHIERGWIVPFDWRERLTRAGFTVPDVVEVDSCEPGGIDLAD